MKMTIGNQPFVLVGAFFPVKDDPLAILLNSLQVMHYNMKQE